ncbi:MAG TPA: FAD-dependent oxidoreductase [Candidatus Paceibacterota bacterium]|nr:FAD-dependent oxidoreductase [Candidatus Paceibacterota bacterium]
MKIRVLGSGFYGCHLAISLLRDGHEVEIHEIADRMFAGASGAIPARIHRGFHYPRSAATRDACNEHYQEFMAQYGSFTHGVPVNLYAVARDHSLIDFNTYKKILRDSAEFIDVEYPEELGLRNVEGAVLTGERHIVIDKVRTHFESVLKDHVMLNRPPEPTDEFDLTIDATFCANQSIGVDRYEPCLVVILRGPTNIAVTVMDGPFPSLYPWNEEQGLSSLSSATWTPFSKSCKTYEEARAILLGLQRSDLEERGQQMIQSMAHFYPAVLDYEPVDYKTSIRAMPLSGSDARLVDVLKTDEKTLRIRAGKIDAVIQAEREVRKLIES